MPWSTQIKFALHDLQRTCCLFFRNALLGVLLEGLREFAGGVELGFDFCPLLRFLRFDVQNHFSRVALLLVSAGFAAGVEKFWDRRFQVTALVGAGSWNDPKLFFSTVTFFIKTATPTFVKNTSQVVRKNSVVLQNHVNVQVVQVLWELTVDQQYAWREQQSKRNESHHRDKQQNSCRQTCSLRNDSTTTGCRLPNVPVVL